MLYKQCLLLCVYNIVRCLYSRYAWRNLFWRRYSCTGNWNHRHTDKSTNRGIYLDTSFKVSKIRKCTYINNRADTVRYIAITHTHQKKHSLRVLLIF